MGREVLRGASAIPPKGDKAVTSHAQEADARHACKRVFMWVPEHVWCQVHF